MTKRLIYKYLILSVRRTDHGTENVGVADNMLAARDCEHGTAVITGRSVHNQRIERVWRDLYQSTMAPFYDTFQ